MKHLSLERRAVRTAVPALAACLAAIAIGAACGSNLTVTTGGDFSAPTGITTVSAEDRDFLFVANAGASDLRAINICTKPQDGGTYDDTCPAEEDFKFVPGPIRIFPGSFPIGNRPLRIAGARLLSADGGQKGGAVLVAGAPVTPGALMDGGVPATPDGGLQPAIYVVDANSVLDTEKSVTKSIAPPDKLPTAGPPIDVVVDERAGAAVRGFALTQATGTSKAEIITLTATLQGRAPAVTVDARCTLDIVPTKLALVPGKLDNLYVADGTPDGVAGGVGDGALEIAVADLLALGVPAPSTAPAACPNGRRLPATDTLASPPRPRPLVSIALNPETVQDVHASPGTNGLVCPDGNAPPDASSDLCAPQVLYPAGSMLLGVTTAGNDLLDPTNPRAGKESGKIVFVRVATGGVAPQPPYGFFDTSAPPMLPLAVNGLAREVAFLTPPPRDKCPGTHPDRPCGLIVVGLRQSFDFSLAAAVTSSDGATYFIDAGRRRFFNDSRDTTTGTTSLGPLPIIDTEASFQPTPAPNTILPEFNFALADVDANGTAIPDGRPRGWVTPGVTRKSRWAAVYHSPLPGLEKRGGTISAKTDTSGAVVGYSLSLPGVDLARLTSLSQSCGLPGRYCLGLGVGDLVSFQTFTPLPGGGLCDELNRENSTPPRELPITAIGTASLELGTTEIPPLGYGPFVDVPASCFPAGVTLEVRVGNGKGGPWLVVQGPEVRGRLGYDQLFLGYEPRFDYPLDPPPDVTDFTQLTDGQQLQLAGEVGVAFTISKATDGSEPQPKSLWFFTVTSGQAQTNVRDETTVAGLAGPLHVYNSPKVTNLVFTSVTGANEILQTDPALIGIVNGTLVYR